ncbi:universal stress protein [Saccharopolyspora phatthalungensis]|uniref:Nucleotide-binding universal stress UspA family protein n=1 Tax=Saccharopolyspora phatthalungensis TaxID=664693 RepID=A0A840QFT8_9PSEU|nr:universal stress protein [Saccharopolyspora phatthalungensis]MBB5159704.1 nucleotide-binding universal stress UspA family protein [Saccharopolyspora phatthalungensis]
MNEQQRYAIIVGIDGSPSSQDALRWAVGQARRTDGEITAVMVWDTPALYDWPLQTAEQLDRVTDETLRKVVRESVDEDDLARIHTQVARGHPAKALLRAAESADLLVVGRRGQGGFSPALLGSISQYCVSHAPCPVVVVRDQRPRSRDGSQGG